MPGSLKDLLTQAGFQPSEPAATEPAPEAQATQEVEYAATVRLRFSRKGRGGKVVTLVSGVVSGRDAVLAKLKRELGIGARIDGDDLVLQGDQRKRAATWFESQGVRRVVVDK